MLETKYDHLKVEEGKYNNWKDKGYFNAGDKSKDPYCLVIPPPNVTGVLHLGHAWDTALQDIIIRYKRMQGYDALWLPGMDHAAIATEAKVVQKLKGEGIDKYEYGREKFLDACWDWTHEHADTIRKQWGKLGLSVDYNRERFTLDEGLNKAVTKVFVDFYNKGLIYRGEKIINWDPEALTALSNEEVIYQDDEGAFYHLKYVIAGTDEYLDVATTRPETLFGDTAVAVNPDDKRYKHLIGKNVILPIVNKEIPIIGDEHADPEFGTGIVKITPAHDPNDFEVGERHNLERIVVMNPDATMNKNALQYEGQTREEEIANISEFLKLKSKEQIEKLNTILDEESGIIFDNENEPVKKNKEAMKTIRTIINLSTDSYSKIVKQSNENTPKNLNNPHIINLICCLLYLDGISMVNIDLIRKINLIFPDSGKELYEFIFELLNFEKLDDRIKEIASHILCLSFMCTDIGLNEEKDKMLLENCQKIIIWNYNRFSIDKTRKSCLTSNLCLLLTIDDFAEIFINQIDKEYDFIRNLYDFMQEADININIIYESLFCLWNLSNNKKFLYVFEKKGEERVQKIAQVIRTNKIDKVARIGLLIIENLLESQSCLETLFNIKFMRTIDILLTNKWNDSIIKEKLNEIYDFLDKNYKIMNSFDKFVKELDTGILKNGSLHSTAFWEENYKEFETNNFSNIRKLVNIIGNKEENDITIEQKSIACFDLGEFARLYPGGASILEYFNAKDHLLLLIKHKNLELKNRALVCLQKLMMKSLKK